MPNCLGNAALVGFYGCTCFSTAVAYLQDLTHTVDNMMDKTRVSSPVKKSLGFLDIDSFSETAPDL